MFYKIELCLEFHSRGELLVMKNGLDLYDLVALSRSQLGQEVLTFLVTRSKRNGYFVEAGAADGSTFSNTRYLEKLYGWSGILCEPSKTFALHLQDSSRRALKDYRALHDQTGIELCFVENTEHPTLSSLDLTLHDGPGKNYKNDLTRYSVLTVSLMDLLNHHAAPSYIDFLSLDTEGNEFDILNSFDFKAFKFGLICCEYNSAGKLEPIEDLLSHQGYTRLKHLEKLSGGDAWFVSNQILTKLNHNLGFSMS